MSKKKATETTASNKADFPIDPKWPAPVAPSGESDPKKRIEFVSQMLEQYGQSGSPILMELREIIYGIANNYEQSDKSETAKAHADAQLHVVEIRVAEMAGFTAKKVRDTFAENFRKSRLVGAQAKNAKDMMEGLNTMVQALDAMLEAATQRDVQARTEAMERFRKVQEKLKKLGAALKPAK